MGFPDLNQGALAAVREEADLDTFVVHGRLPAQLHGTLVRNGPNPFSGVFAGTGVLSWWPEAAMLHAVTFAHGRVCSYRNRWLRTRAWGDYTNVPDSHLLVASNPNVNVLQHAGEALALAEGGPPVAINDRLDTLGPSRRHAALRTGTCAHPKIDAVTGELMSFRADWNAPWLTYGVTDASGHALYSATIDVPGPAMTHDMAITGSYSILFDLNVAYDFSLLSKGHRIPIRWHPERQSRLALVPRHGGPVRWVDIQPCFIQHVVNAYDDSSGAIVLEVARYARYFDYDEEQSRFLPDPLAHWWRYRIDPVSGAVQEQQLSDIHIELPRINESMSGYRHRYLYAVEQPSTVEMRGVIRFDRKLGTEQRYVVPIGDQNSEPVFVPRPGATDEDDGWVLVCVYRRATDSSDVVILDARDISAGPVATVEIGRRIPAGFHGAWLPGGSG